MARTTRDGESHNRSYNFGVEGPTDDPQVLALRARQQRNFLATLMLSQGVPMLLHGDELGRTQQGNNNTYAHDSELTWVHWDTADAPLIEFTAALCRLRKEHPTFRRRNFFDGRPVRRRSGERIPDIVWLRPDGSTMEPEDWDSPFGRAVGMFLNGDGIPGRSSRGERILDKHFLILFNAHDHEMEFVLPPAEYADKWEVVIDTAGELADSGDRHSGSVLAIDSKSLVVLRRHDEPVVEVDHSVAASLAVLAGSQADEASAARPALA